MITENNYAATSTARTDRFLLAIFGGYVLAAFVAMVTGLAFPAQLASATLSGTLLAFMVHTGVFIWVFIVHSTRKATLGVLIPTAVFAIAYWFLKK